MKTPSILITGASGMLGRTVSRHFQDHQTFAFSRGELDICDAQSVHACFMRTHPNVVIHCAAMTRVDDCESQQQEAFGVNETGTANVARSAAEIGARLIAVSTDYVFAGNGSEPYGETDATAPRTVYGKSKLLGEQAALTLCPNALVARIAWLYGPGGPSFFHTMAKLGALEGEPLQVVDDQAGNPTSTLAVAEGLRRLLATDLRGVVHLTCEGEASWFQFAKAIFERLGLGREIEPCSSERFVRPAPRPQNSRLFKGVLNRAGIGPMPNWESALDEFIEKFPEG